MVGERNPRQDITYEWDQASTREAVKGRSDGICEVCRAARATDMHHRISAGTGGKWEPANFLYLCRGCHSWITDHPKESYGAGFSVHSYDDPESIPVQRLTGETLHLSNDIAPPLKKSRRT